MIRVRIAPSPTGFLHMGGARTYIFHWLFAQSRKGTMVERIDDIAASFSDEFSIEPKAEKNLSKQNARELLHDLAERPAKTNEFSEQAVEQEVRGFITEREVKAGLVINAARAALSGQSAGPSAFVIFAALGRDRVVQRLRGA